MPQKLYRCSHGTCKRTVRKEHTYCEPCRATFRKAWRKRYYNRVGHSLCVICGKPAEPQRIHCTEHTVSRRTLNLDKYRRSRVKSIDDVLHHLGRAYNNIVQTVEYGKDYIPDDVQHMLRNVTALLLSVKDKLGGNSVSTQDV